LNLIKTGNRILPGLIACMSPELPEISRFLRDGREQSPGAFAHFIPLLDRSSDVRYLRVASYKYALERNKRDTPRENHPPKAAQYDYGTS
jgi:hypothetical protein